MLVFSRSQYQRALADALVAAPRRIAVRIRGMSFTGVSFTSV
jgi:hypothetical protein